MLATSGSAVPAPAQRKTGHMGKLNRLFSSASSGPGPHSERSEPRSGSTNSNSSAKSTASAGSDGEKRGKSKSKSPQVSRASSVRSVRSKHAPGEHSAASSIVSVNSTANANNASFRFHVYSDGRHEHHLKRAKRQEKLGQMVKSWIGAGSGNAKKQSSAVSAVADLFSGQGNGTDISGSLPPTLLSTYLQQQKEARHVAPSQRSTEGSLCEKYGRCQEILGKGTFGVVRLSHKKIGSQEKLFAVKEFTRQEGEPDVKYSKRLTSEFCISSSLKHVNIIAAYDLLKDSSGGYCEVMEYCSGGDLYSLIVSAGKLEYIEADCFFKQLVRAVHYMHEMGVAHRDLKPENILLTQNGVVKVTDFGSAECFRTAWEEEDDVTLSHGIRGSSPYIAPESYTEREYDPRCVDVWACGVIYMAMRTGRQLWKEARREDEFYAQYCRRRRCESGYEPIEALKRARCRNVVYSVLDPVPKRRITTRQVLNSEWVREIRCCNTI